MNRKFFFHTSDKTCQAGEKIQVAENNLIQWFVQWNLKFQFHLRPTPDMERKGLSCLAQNDDRTGDFTFPKVPVQLLGLS